MGKKLSLGIGAGIFVFGALLVPIGGLARSVPDHGNKPMDLTAFSDAKPDANLDLLFVHHSVGGQLLADPGSTRDLADSIHSTHENGGGLRRLLSAEGYAVHEVSYGSALGENTDLFDWLPKFQTKMDAILRARFNDEKLSDGDNDVVLFKSCYPNNRFVGMGQAPGNAAGPELTVWNARATFSKLLEEFKKQPNKLFVYLTAPPNAPGFGKEPLLKVVAKKALGKPTTAEVMAERARLAREFNSWVAAPDGWLKGYPLKNVVVFDYYDVLTGGESNFLAYPSGDGSDSHPTTEGQQRAAKAFVPFLNRAVRRAGLSE